MLMFVGVNFFGHQTSVIFIRSCWFHHLSFPPNKLSIFSFSQFGRKPFLTLFFAFVFPLVSFYVQLAFIFISFNCNNSQIGNIKMGKISCKNKGGVNMKEDCSSKFFCPFPENLSPKIIVVCPAVVAWFVRASVFHSVNSAFPQPTVDQIPLGSM